MKTKTRGNSLEAALEYYKRKGAPFTLVRTGYTASLHANDADGREIKHHFSEGGGNPSTFGIARRLAEMVTAAGVPAIDRTPSYFDLSGVKERKELPPVCWCIDLTSAYVQALFNLRLIDAAMFQELQRLPKADRLRVVGMLATAKTYFYYSGERLIGDETKYADTRGAFLAACNLIGDTMDEVKDWPGYMLYWVDGVFFDREAPEVADHFAAQGLPCKVERLTGVHWSPSKRFLFFSKEGERKYLTMPAGRKPAPQWIAKLLSQPCTDTTPGADTP